jgi:hypothetical protein
MPPTQASKDEQATPHPPQLLGSLWKSTQESVDPQQPSPAGQAQPTQDPP